MKEGFLRDGGRDGAESHQIGGRDFFRLRIVVRQVEDSEGQGRDGSAGNKIGVDLSFREWAGTHDFAVDVLGVDSDSADVRSVLRSDARLPVDGESATSLYRNV